jgi:hypothetical protein
MQEELYQQHPARHLIGQFADLEKKEAFTDPAMVSNVDFLANRDFIFAVAKTIGEYFEQTPSNLVSKNLNSLTAPIQNAFSELVAFTSDRNVNRVVNASNYMDQVPSLLSCFVPKSLVNKPVLTGKIVSGLQEASQGAIQQVENQKNALEKEFLALQTKYQEQEKKIGELSEAISKQKADALAVVAQVQKEFAETEQKRIMEFSTNVAGFKETYQTFSEGQVTLAGTLIKDIEKSRNDAKDLLQVVGAITLTGNYQKVAEAEEKQANTWRKVTTGFFSTGVLLALVSVGFAFAMRWLHPLLPVSDVYIDLLMRLITAIAITSPAWYFARESARHRTNADRAKQRETELTSLGPFIELLPEEKKNEIRATLTQRYFGNDVETHQINTAFSGADATTIVGKVIDAIPKPNK